MNISKASMLGLISSMTTYDEVKKEPCYKLKGTHENAKPIPKKKNRKKRGY